MKMNILLIPLLLFHFFCISENTPANHTLQDAVKLGLVQCNFTGNANSPHYMRPLLGKIKNTSSKPLEVRIDNGLQFTADDPEYQNLIITHSGTIALKPQEEKELTLYAMCTESSDLAPGTGTGYKLGAPATGNMKKLANFIETQKLHSSTGQQAVWCLSNGEELSTIAGFDTGEVRSLQRFLASVTGKPLPPPPAQNDYLYNYYAPQRSEVSFEGVINFNFSAVHDISLGLFNTRGVLVRELYNKASEARGPHKIEYAFDNSIYDEPVYFVRLLVDGDIKINRKIEMN